MRWSVHLGLFLATCVTTFTTFLFVWGGGVASADLGDQATGAGLFTFVALAILGAHEMGHYLMARQHHVEASLPYFIPVPMLGFGTMGAVIRLRGRVPTRNALVDIGAAGPLAGLMIAVPALVAGMLLSHVDSAPATAEPFPPNLSLWSLAAYAGKAANAWFYGKPLEDPWQGIQLFGDSGLTWVLQRVIHGKLGAGQELYAHPVFIASWFGLLVTMLNLIPVGQLDGGHLTHAWFGEKAEPLGRAVASVLLVLALFFSASWLVWFFIVTRIIGFKHPPVMEPQVPLSRARKVTCAVSFAFTLLTFMPMPLGVL